MPTAQNLDDVLQVKQNLIEAAIEKLKIYNTEIEKAITQLSLKRTELKTLTSQIDAERRELNRISKESIVDYSADVRRLDSEIATRQTYLKKLDEDIEKKKDFLANQANEAKDAYEKQEAMVVEEYKNLMQKIALYDQQLAAVQSRDDHAESRHRDVDTRETEIDRREAALKTREQDKSHEWTHFEGEHHKKMTNLNHQVTSLKAEEAAFQCKKDELRKKEVKADEILRRINEAEGILAQAQNVATQNKVDREVLNADKVKWISDSRRLAQKEEELRKKEESLIQREHNIKLAEEHLAQG